MQVKAILSAMGDRAHVCRLLGVTSGRYSHFLVEQSLADHHIRFFIALKPELDWSELLGANRSQFADLLAHPSVKNVRNSRLRARQRLEKKKATQTADAA